MEGRKPGDVPLCLAVFSQSLWKPLPPALVGRGVRCSLDSCFPTFLLQITWPNCLPKILAFLVLLWITISLYAQILLEFPNFHSFGMELCRLPHPPPPPTPKMYFCFAKREKQSISGSVNSLFKEGIWSHRLRSGIILGKTAGVPNLGSCWFSLLSALNYTTKHSTITW